MKVLFVAENLGYGGAQKMLTFVANNLDRTKYNVAILNQNSNAEVARPLNDDVEYYAHPQYTSRGFRRFQELCKILKVCKKTKPDIIVSFLNMPNFLSTFAGWLKGIPVIVSERGDPSQNMGKVDVFMRNFEKKAAGAVFQTEGAKAFYPEKLRKKSEVIPNPVVPYSGEEVFEYRKNIKNIAFVGRMENRQKRMDVAVRAVAEVCEKYPEVCLNFYGSGPDEEEIKNLTKELGVTDNVVFHGKTGNIHKELVKNDIFLITSDYEGIPNSLIEAMSIGMPCIATDCSPGGAALLIEHEKNGVLLPCGDPNAVADAILNLIENSELAVDCGKNATDICNRFSPEIIIEKWNNYIYKIVTGEEK